MRRRIFWKLVNDGFICNFAKKNSPIIQLGICKTNGTSEWNLKKGINLLSTRNFFESLSYHPKSFLNLDPFIILTLMILYVLEYILNSIAATPNSRIAFALQAQVCNLNA